jgi:hypothetical protein
LFLGSDIALLGTSVVGVSLNAGHEKPDLVRWKASDGGNGHYYGMVMPNSPEGNYSWSDAESAASSMKFHGKRGYLATITSPGENAFLGSNFASHLFDNGALNPGIGPTNFSYAWKGLFAPTPISDFEWVTGETVSYTNWAPLEPNYFGTPL